MITSLTGGGGGGSGSDCGGGGGGGGGGDRLSVAIMSSQIGKGG